MPSLRLWRYRIFAVTWLAYAGFYLCRKNISVVMPLLQSEAGYSKLELANVVVGFSLFYAAGQFVSGILCDRLGSRLVVSIGLAIAAVSNCAMGLAWSAAMLALLACLNGAGQSTGWPGLVKNMAYWFVPAERGVVMAWWGTNYVLGGFLATIFATFAVTHATPFAGPAWRRGFFAPALLLAAIATVFATLARNRPSDAGLADLEAADAAQNRNARSRAIFLGVLADPTVWVLAASYFFVKMTRYSILFWLPLYMTERLRYGVGEAGYTSSVYELVGFLGAILAGYVSDKLLDSRRFPVAAVMLWGLAAVSFLHPILAAQGHLGNGVGIALMGILTYGPDTLISGAAAQDTGSSEGAATAAGFINGVGSLGQLASPYLVAYVTQRFGWDALFHLFLVFAVAGGGLLATKWRYTAAVHFEARFKLPSGAAAAGKR